MAKVIANMSMSLDGFVADPSDGIEHLFGWYFNGDVTVPTANPNLTFRTSEASAAHLRDAFASVGALIAGRRLFDVAGGWGGRHPVDVPVFVVTHTVPDGWPRDDAPFTFVTDGIESALAQAKATAGEQVVAVASPNIAQQYLNAGLLDEISVDLVPVLLGKGIRFFDNLANTPIKLDDPRIIEGTGVTHLIYRVKPD
jgi:dihydrofolate reductase